MYHHNKQL